MKFGRIDLFVSFLIFIIAGIFVLDVFLTSGRPASFDSPFHITNIAQFQLALQSGDFPVTWTDGLANYGLPMSIVAHQLTNYSGALLTFITRDPVITFNILSFTGIFLSSLFYYFFLRLYFKPIPSFAATYLFTFSTYKIINFYIRGAMPEVFSGIFLPLMLIGMYLFIKRDNLGGFFLLVIATFLLALNHPMMLFIYAFVFFPYLLFLLFTDNDRLHFSLIKRMSTVKKLIAAIAALVIGVGMAGYYIIPLNVEIKYFYYGLIKNHLTPDSYLGLADYFKIDWQYFTASEVYTRGHIIQFGVVESIGIVAGIFLVLWKQLIKKERTFGILEFSVVLSLLLLFFSSSLTDFLYSNISILSNIQFPWRMLSALLFLPPIMYAYVFTKLNREIPVLGFILIISLLTFSQLYGKNFVAFEKSNYYFTPYNPHSVLMNTIWSGKTEEYPIKKSKPEIIDGKGEILKKIEKNSSREYTVNASTPLRVVDYTFYFPGWKVTFDGVDTPIEFQDPKYRGVITYVVPQGEHAIQLKFEDTRVRLLGKVASVAFIALFVVTILFRKRLGRYVFS